MPPLPLLLENATLGHPNDPAEAEAARASDRPERLRDSPPPQPPGQGAPPLGRRLAARVAAGLHGGQPLPSGTRAFFEQRFGADLGAVRVHDGPRPADAARALGARAFTLGRDVVFGAGHYAPGNAAGRRLLGHELAHVLQGRNAAAPVIRRDMEAVKGVIGRFTTLNFLDHDALGAELVSRVDTGGVYDFVQQVLDELGSTDRDDVAEAFMKAAGDPLLAKMVADVRGRRLLDRLFHELTEGSLAESEKVQSDRILTAKTRARVPIGTFARATQNPKTKIFPLRVTGPTKFDTATIFAHRNPNGSVFVAISPHTLGTAMFRGETKTLNPDVGTGIDIPEDEIVGVKDYDHGGALRFGPALMLVEVANQSDTKVQEKVAGFSAVVASAGLGALAGLGLEASVAARVVAFADHAATVIGALGIVIDDHRGDILSAYGERGASFLRAWDKVESATILYGFGRLGFGAGKLLINGLRSAYKNLRALSDAKSLSNSEKALLNNISSETEDVLKTAEQIEASAAPKAPPLASSARTVEELTAPLEKATGGLRPPAFEPGPSENISIFSERGTAVVKEQMVKNLKKATPGLDETAAAAAVEQSAEEVLSQRFILKPGVQLPSNVELAPMPKTPLSLNVPPKGEVDPQKVYLFTIDREGAKFAREKIPFTTGRGNIVHTNLSVKEVGAFAGGEAIFISRSEIVINRASGRFGAQTEAQYQAVIKYLEGLGFKVHAVAFEAFK